MPPIVKAATRSVTRAITRLVNNEEGGGESGGGGELEGQPIGLLLALTYAS